MKLNELLKSENFKTGSGFPEGDTIINIGEVDVEETEYEGRKTWKLTFADSKILYAPKTVLGKIQDLAKNEFKKMRVTRSGTGLKDTAYTVIGLKEEEK